MTSYSSPTAPHASAAVPADLHNRAVRAGQTLYYAGDAASSMYRLDSGLMRAVRLTPQGRHLTVRHIRPGDIFGEETLHGQARTHQVVALTAATLTPIFPQLLAPADLWDLTRSLSSQLQRMMSDGIHIQDGDLRERIARYLLNLAGTTLGGAHADGTRFVRATHELIAEGTGATRESVSKLIGEMRDDGLILPAYRCLTLLDEENLQRLSGQQEG